MIGRQLDSWSTKVRSLFNVVRHVGLLCNFENGMPWQCSRLPSAQPLPRGPAACPQATAGPLQAAREQRRCHKPQAHESHLHMAERARVGWLEWNGAALQSAGRGHAVALIAAHARWWREPATRRKLPTSVRRPRITWTPALKQLTTVPNSSATVAPLDTPSAAAPAGMPPT